MVSFKFKKHLLSTDQHHKATGYFISGKFTILAKKTSYLVQFCKGFHEIANLLSHHDM